MKKAMLFLAVLGAMIICPFGVDAKLKLEIGKDPVSAKDTEDKKAVIKTYDIYVVTDANEKVEKAEVKFEYGKAITELKCKDASDYVASQNGENPVKCAFELPSEKEPKQGEKIKVGQIEITAKKDAKDADCTINYTFEGASGKMNPNTGISIPYAFIIGGVVLAAGVYYATNKKSKLVRL